ncbi:MAG: hypothetical protein LBC86_07540, partial [Oscillospiraceae bacterium]|nr:hypothetical protein [Oscillospiraceae bacterium]
MKKLLIILLILSLVFALTSCGGADEPDAEQVIHHEPQIDREPEEVIEPEEVVELDPEVVNYLQENFRNFNIDGSTSMIPLHQLLNNKFGDRSEVWHGRTVWAFEQFINGEIDILFSVDFS